MPTNTKSTNNLLVDRLKRPMRDLRISVTDRCNFRCTYCMPVELYGEKYRFLPKSEILTYEEVSKVARAFVRLGVRKIRLTGGEPLVRDDIQNLVTRLASIAELEDLAMTTNGYLLSTKAQVLKASGLQRVSVSVDTLDDEVFGRMNGRGFGVKEVLHGIQAASEAGLGPIKIDSVIQRGVNDHTLIDLVKYFKDTPHIVRFIEYMDVGNLNGWKHSEVIPSQEIIERIHAVFPIEPVEPNYFGEVADRYRYLDGSGEIGVISSVTQPFCSTCTRVRLSPDGRIFTCLFATNGFDIKEPIRDGASESELDAILSGIWSKRSDRYSDVRASLSNTVTGKIEMYQIGG